MRSEVAPWFWVPARNNRKGESFPNYVDPRDFFGICKGPSEFRRQGPAASPGTYRGDGEATC
jgi:hypothetical protein